MFCTLKTELKAKLGRITFVKIQQVIALCFRSFICHPSRLKRDETIA
jgi:hypothetical protein